MLNSIMSTYIPIQMYLTPPNGSHRLLTGAELPPLGRGDHSQAAGREHHAQPGEAGEAGTGTGTGAGAGEGAGTGAGAGALGLRPRSSCAGQGTCSVACPPRQGGLSDEEEPKPSGALAAKIFCSPRARHYFLLRHCKLQIQQNTLHFEPISLIFLILF
jgi:hypothetical protein